MHCHGSFEGASVVLLYFSLNLLHGRQESQPCRTRQHIDVSCRARLLQKWLEGASFVGDVLIQSAAYPDQLSFHVDEFL